MRFFSDILSDQQLQFPEHVGCEKDAGCQKTDMVPLATLGTAAESTSSRQVGPRYGETDTAEQAHTNHSVRGGLWVQDARIVRALFTRGCHPTCSDPDRHGTGFLCDP